MEKIYLETADAYTRKVTDTKVLSIANKIDTILGDIRKRVFNEDIISASDIYTNQFNSNKIVLLNFDDDTFRPVINYDENDMIALKKLYNDCNITIDIENTPYIISHGLDPFTDKTFKDIKIEHKSEFVDNHLPLLLLKKELTEKIEREECKFLYGLNDLKLNSIKTDKCKKIIEILKIDIPENLAEQKYSIEDMQKKKVEYIRQLFPKYTSKENENSKTSDIKEEPEAVNSCFSKDILPGDIYPYNVLYNTLAPEFSSNCMSISEQIITSYVGDVDTTLAQKRITNINVILNHKYLQTKVLINPDPILENMIHNYPEYGFFYLFSFKTTNNLIVKSIEDKCDNCIFENIEDLNKRLSMLSDEIYYMQQNEDSKEAKNELYANEEAQVKQYFKYYYDITDNIEHRIKASALCDILMNNLLVDIKTHSVNSFRNRLSKYLTDLGLKKKRFNDGFYYYGVRPILPDPTILKMRTLHMNEMKKSNMLSDNSAVTSPVIKLEFDPIKSRDCTSEWYCLTNTRNSLSYMDMPDKTSQL
jgi:hypothetical protein